MERQALFNILSTEVENSAVRSSVGVVLERLGKGLQPVKLPPCQRHLRVLGLNMPHGFSGAHALVVDVPTGKQCRRSSDASRAMDINDMAALKLALDPSQTLIDLLKRRCAHVENR